MYVCACMSVCFCMCVCLCMWVSFFTYVFDCVRVRVLCMRACMRACVHACVYVRVFMCVCFACACVCVCVYLCASQYSSPVSIFTSVLLSTQPTLSFSVPHITISLLSHSRLGLAALVLSVAVNKKRPLLPCLLRIQLSPR